MLGFAAKLTEALSALASMRAEGDTYVKNVRTTLLTLVYGSVFLMLRGELSASREAHDRISEKIKEALL